MADGRVHADYRALRRQLAFENRHDGCPDVFGLRRAAGQVVVHVQRLVERLQRVVEDRQVQRALRHLGLRLRATSSDRRAWSPNLPCTRCRTLPADCSSSPARECSLRWAHEPNATRTFDFCRISWAMYSCSLVRMPPLNRQTSMLWSGIFSTSLTLPSVAQGQKTMSNASATSRISRRLPARRFRSRHRRPPSTTPAFPWASRYCS